jgi:hypothetical protein
MPRFAHIVYTQALARPFSCSEAYPRLSVEEISQILWIHDPSSHNDLHITLDSAKEQ